MKMIPVALAAFVLLGAAAQVRAECGSSGGELPVSASS